MSRSAALFRFVASVLLVLLVIVVSFHIAQPMSDMHFQLILFSTTIGSGLLLSFTAVDVLLAITRHSNQQTEET